MDEETREFLRRLFEPLGEIPADVVPHPEPTPAEQREHLLQLDRMADTWGTVVKPGEVVTDVDGLPIGVGPSSTERVFFGGAGVTRAEVEAAGLTPEDVPNLHVIDIPPRKEATDE